LIALVSLATLLGAAVRIAVTHGLSLEEIKTVDQARRSLPSLISHLVHGGVHPPLHLLLVWGMLHLLGAGDFSVRLPSLLAGVLLIPVVAALGNELFDRRTAAVAAALAAVAPVLVWYSKEVSGYELVALFGTLSVLGTVRAVRRGRPADWGLHTVAATLLVWSGWSGIFTVPATELVLLVALAERHRAHARLRPFLLAWALDTLALACQLGALGLLLAAQLRADGGLAGVMGVGAAGVSFYSTVTNASWAIFGFQPATVTKDLAAVWPLAMLSSLAMIGSGVGRRAWLALLCTVAPALGVLALGFLIPGAFDVRYAIGAVPPVLALAAGLATGWARGQIGRALTVGLLVLVLLGALVDQQINPANPRRYDFRPAVAQLQREAGPGAAVFYEPAQLRAVLARDAPGLRASPLRRHLPTRRQADSVFVITSFSNSPSLLRLRNREIGALRATRHLVSHRNYPGVQVWWFR
jgi:hypothetical protein